MATSTHWGKAYLWTLPLFRSCFAYWLRCEQHTLGLITWAHCWLAHVGLLLRVRRSCPSRRSSYHQCQLLERWQVNLLYPLWQALVAVCMLPNPFPYWSCCRRKVITKIFELERHHMSCVTVTSWSYTTVPSLSTDIARRTTHISTVTPTLSSLLEPESICSLGRRQWSPNRRIL